MSRHQRTNRFINPSAQCAAILLTCTCALAQQQVDLNNDGFADTVRRELRLHMTDPVISRIVMVSGSDSSELYSVPSKYINDMFGWYVSPVGDLDGDGFEDLAVSAPACLLEEARGPEHPDGPRPALKGRIDLVSGASGSGLGTIFNPEITAGSIFGLAVAPVPDQDDDGLPDLVVGGTRFIAASQGGSIPSHSEYRWWVISTATGEPLRIGLGPLGSPGCEFLATGQSPEAFWQAHSIAGPQVILPGVIGDLDADGDVDEADAAALIGTWSAQEPGAWQVGDLDGNGEVSISDLSILLGQLGIPPDFMEAIGDPEIIETLADADLKFRPGLGGLPPCAYEPGGCHWWWNNWGNGSAGFNNDGNEGGGCPSCPPDQDHDGIPDGQDGDDDNNGIPDTGEHDQDDPDCWAEIYPRFVGEATQIPFDGPRVVGFGADGNYRADLPGGG